MDLLWKSTILLWESLAPFMAPLVTSFLSVLIGAMPFIVIAAFASALLEVVVPRDLIARLLPRNGLWGILAAPIVSLVFPMCECGIVPVARRLIQKGVPASSAVTFMLANPILNPLAIYATYLAFPGFRTMVWLRLGLGYLVAVGTGVIVHFAYRGRPAADILHAVHVAPPAGDDEVAATCECGHDHGHHHHHHGAPSFGDKVQAVLDHATSEFFDVTKFFLIGSALAAISQAAIDRRLLEAVGARPVLSVLVMMLFAYLVCICSEADAFVAATFTATFAPGALLGFLVLGPMTDIKNTLMMLSAFRRRFVVFLNIALVLLTGVVAITANLLLPRLGR